MQHIVTASNSSDIQARLNSEPTDPGYLERVYIAYDKSKHDFDYNGLRRSYEGGDAEEVESYRKEFDGGDADWDSSKVEPVLDGTIADLDDIVLADKERNIL